MEGFGPVGIGYDVGMLDLLDGQTLQPLLAHDRPPCVSIYLPTDRAGRGTQQGPIRLGNLIDTAEERLVELGLRAPEAKQLLDEARSLQVDRWYWQHQEDGLAVLAAPGRFHTFRLPITVNGLAVVSSRFHVKPLIRTIADDGRFVVLALSRNQVRLLAATRDRVAEISMPDDAPISKADALRYHDPEKQLQHHGADRTGRGTVSATFHGHGTPDEKDDERDEAFLRTIDSAARSVVERGVPMVLAGVEELVTRFRSISDHRPIVEDAVLGNPDHLTPGELHDRAWLAVEPQLSTQAEQDRLQLGNAGIEGVDAVLPAAVAGRVAALFAAEDDEVWARLDGEQRWGAIHDEYEAGDRDLLDVAAAMVWSRDGRVHLTPAHDVPGNEPIAAVLRY